ncbi:hypothetical protein [Alkalihalobacillus trypoxylicola]|uniref:Nucleotidyltransferase n=1 Tax=Alkalihalobacillus trypoxylicola TaxID=519424 RepID=A0A162DF60_9BACI|nr:hypothetical protein [Alkalihalobacillus trypoxylicola]KYG29437.1 hypothetical protein AZF04_07905 [Alkalihalobacillus trypoxylicola]
MIRDYVKIAKSFFGSELHSIYIRGSIANGNSIDGISDLDTIIVLSKNVQKDLTPFTLSKKELMKDYPVIVDIESNIVEKEALFDLHSSYMLSFMIQTYSLCVYGENIQPRLPRFKADQNLANQHLLPLENQIQVAIDDLQNNEGEADILDCCQWIMKILIRAGAALFIGENNRYTRDLYPAYKRFSQYNPEREKEMRMALEYAIEPINDPHKIIMFLKQFGSWFIPEAELWLVKHNPKRLQYIKKS